MATGVIRNFLVPGPPTCYLPMILQHSLPHRKVEESGEEEEKEEVRGERGGEREEEEEEYEDSEVLEEEEEFLEEAVCFPAPCPSDMTSQLLRFADVISLDVQRYFGRCPDDPEACDIYTDRISTATSGRLRYYDDLVRMARSGNQEDPESVSVASGNLGPLAELFDHCWGRCQDRGRPMNKRHLPLSFWTEPIPGPVLSMSSSTQNISSHHTQDNTQALDTHTHNRHTQDNTQPLDTHTQENTHPDFSDLLAHWDPNPDLTH